MLDDTDDIQISFARMQEKTSKGPKEETTRYSSEFIQDAQPLMMEGRRAVTEKRGDIFDGADERGRNKNGDVMGVPLSYEIRKRAVNFYDEGKRPKEVAELLSISHKTALKLQKSIKSQCLEKGPDNKTLGVPLPGKQGGWRWSRLNQTQQVACSQIAVEHPTWTIAQIKEEVESMFGIAVSDEELTTGNISLGEFSLLTGRHFYQLTGIIHFSIFYSIQPQQIRLDFIILKVIFCGIFVCFLKYFLDFLQFVSSFRSDVFIGYGLTI